MCWVYLNSHWPDSGLIIYIRQKQQSDQRSRPDLICLQRVQESVQIGQCFTLLGMYHSSSIPEPWGVLAVKALPDWDFLAKTPISEFT